MLIEDPEKFKTWLTAKLEPLCDADPAALAKYVYALVKKDRPVDELKTSMREQLEVFLQKETDSFVEALFNNLSLSEPTSESVKKPTQKKEEEVAVKSAPVASADSKPEPNPPAEPDLREVLNAAHRENQNKKEALPKEPDKDDKSRPSGVRRRRLTPSLSPEVRRGRSPYDRRRSRSRSRERDRSARWRNKSPPRRHDLRRRSFSKSPGRRISRSPPPKRSGRYRNRSPPRSLSRSRSPFSPSHSGDRDGKSSPELLQRDVDPSVPLSHSSSHHPGVTDPNQPRRCRDYDEKGFCMRGDLCPFDHGSDPVILEDITRGGLFNGAAALGVGVSNQILSASQLLQSSSPSRLDYNPTSSANVEHRYNWRRFHRPPHHLRGMTRGLRVSSINSNLPKRELISVVTSETDQSSVIPQNNGQLSHNSVPFRGSYDSNLALRDKPRYDPYNLGNRRVLRVSPTVPGNCTLQLKKVPVHQNNITQLNNHFSKFGKIVKILVGYENDAEAALVTFSSHSEATAAYKSTEAVLNNRFIKVFWHNPNGINNENKPDIVQPVIRPTALERLGSPAPKILHTVQPTTIAPADRVTMTNNSLTKTIFMPMALKKVNNIQESPEKNPAIATSQSEESVKDPKKSSEDAMEPVKMNIELRKRKQSLLEKQINHQKLLIQRIESGNVKPDQKTAIMDAIKSLQESIENLKKELSEEILSTTVTLASKGKIKDSSLSFRKSKEETQRQLLDAELDLLKQEQQGGGNLVEIKKKISELKMKAYKLKIPISKTTTPFFRGSYRGRGSVSVRGRSAPPSRYTYNADYNVVDHRPTKLLVSGYEEDDKEDVITHFNQFGEIINYTSDDATPSLILNYKSRKEAEVALQKGRNFQDRLLSVTWATPNHNIRPGVTTQNTPVPYNPPTKDDSSRLPTSDPTRTTEDEFLLSPTFAGVPVGEEEENEDRAWRR